MIRPAPPASAALATIPTLLPAPTMGWPAAMVACSRSRICCLVKVSRSPTKGGTTNPRSAVGLSGELVIGGSPAFHKVQQPPRSRGGELGIVDVGRRDPDRGAR